MKPSKTLLLVLLLPFLFSAASMGGKDMGAWGAERLWREYTGRVVNETNLLKSLMVDKQAQTQDLQRWGEEIIQAHREGLISEAEMKRAVQEILIIPEQYMALQIINGNNLKSQRIEHAVLEVYGENMDDQAIRFQCVEIMLNNDFEKGIKMLREFVADKERVGLGFRLMGAGKLQEQGRLIDNELLNEGQTSTNKIFKARAERLQKIFEQKLIQEPIQMIAPSCSPVLQEPIGSQVKTAQPTNPIVGVEIEPATHQNQYLQPAEESTRSWRFILLVLGILTVSVGVFSTLRKRKKGSR